MSFIQSHCYLYWDPQMTVFILVISAELFLSKHVPHLQLWKKMTQNPHSPPETCQRPSCELPLVSRANTPDQGDKTQLLILFSPALVSSRPLVSRGLPWGSSSLASWTLFQSSHQSSWALPSWLLWWALPLSSFPGIFFWTPAAESCKLQLQQTLRTSPCSSEARSCVAPEQLARAVISKPNS